MPTPRSYYELQIQHDKLRALAFKLTMSSAADWDRPETRAVFDMVGDLSDKEADAALKLAAEMEAKS